MKQINLLPKTIQQKANRQRVWIWLLVIFLFGTANTISIWAWMEGKVITFEHELTSWQNKEEAQRKQQLKLALKADADFQERVKLLNGFSQKETSWSKVFKLAGAITPQDIRLLSLASAVSVTDGNLSLKLSGEAPSNVSFAVFHQSLKNNVKISSLKVDNYSYDTGTGRVKFVLTVKFPSSEVAYLKTAATPTPSSTPTR